MSQSEVPDSPQQIAEIVRDAISSNQKLEIVGGRSKSGFGHSVDGTELSTSGLGGIELYEPEALTIVAGAGTPLREITETLAQNGQHLPFEPVDYSTIYQNEAEPTIGGTVACGNSGSRRIQAGACRDSMIGVEFVSGEGELIKNGGRVMKNVTGYDLVKLLTGSHGTLGIITKVSFKLLPAPQFTATLIIEGLDDNKAVQAMSKGLGSAYDLTGAAHLPAEGDMPSRTCFRLEGFEKSVIYRGEQLKQLLSSFGTGKLLDKSDEARNIWQDINNASDIGSKAGDLWKLSLKPGDSSELIAKISGKLDVSTLYDWGGGLVWLLVHNPTENDAAIIRGQVNEIGGHATLIRSSGQSASIPVFHPQPGPLGHIAEKLRLQFDPHSILNLGRMSGGGVA